MTLGDTPLFGYRLNEAGVANHHSLFLGYTGKVYEVLLKDKADYISFFALLMKVGSGSPCELRNALVELREAGLMVLTRNVTTLEKRIVPIVTKASPVVPETPHESRMSAVRASLRRAVIHRSTEHVDLDALNILIEDHRRISFSSSEI